MLCSRDLLDFLANKTALCCSVKVFYIDPSSVKFIHITLRVLQPAGQ